MTILIVDDNEPNLYQLQVLLVGNGYQVVSAANGAEALTTARQNPPDLIISDILMPVMDGYALCHEWQRDERLRQIPFVFYTATYTDERDREFALSIGAEQFLVKPEDTDVFMRSIRGAIAQVDRPPAYAGLLPERPSALISEVESPREDFTYLKQYNEVLIRKLEGKMQELEQANRDLESDITQRKRVESEHIRLVTAIEQSAEAVVITNTQGDIEYVNPAFTRITGYSREDVVGHNPRILKSDKQDPAFYQQLWATILKGEIWHGEIINRRKDGKEYTEEMNIAPVRGARGEITHFIATNKDVTERKNLENQFRQAQKLEAVGRLAAGVAHDFNNLLTVIMGYCRLAVDVLGCHEPPREYLTEVLAAADRAASLTRQLLAFSRQQTLQPTILNLNEVMAGMEKMLRPLIGEHIELVFVPDPAVGRVKADAGQIEQVIMNLAVNSSDAMPQGGKLTIETANVEIDEAYARDHVGAKPGSYVMLAVSDTGCGMDAETRAKIFEPFFTTKEKHKGTGLGLSTVYGIVKQSEGNIWVYSEPKRGTTFKVYLPQVQQAQNVATTVKPAVAASRPLTGTETILVVEDEEAVRSLVRATLEVHGYKVLSATRGDEALSLSAGHPCHIALMITDLVMPGHSGQELAELITSSRPEMRVLYMSGYTDDTVVRHHLLDPTVPFVQKPFVPDSLVRKVREVLDAGRE